MKKLLLFLLTAILSLNCYSQITFEQGYYIDNTNQKINCLIKTIDWNNNPAEFEYKLSEMGETKKATLKSVKEFGVNNKSKYVRSNVNIDRSSKVVNSLSRDRNPNFKKEELFLKVLIEGKANLYQYTDKSVMKFFYKKENSTIEQLVFKNYITAENKIAENNHFRQQLWNDLKCTDFKLNKIKSVDYNKKDLIHFFTEYTNCHNSDLTNFEPKIKRDVFNLTIRPRLNSSSLTVESTNSSLFKNQDFGNKTGFGIGLEAEIIIPINKNKWSFVIEPTYQSFKSEIIKNEIFSGFDTTVKYKVEYSSIEVPLSLRHYFFLNESSKIYINATYVLDLRLDSSFIKIENSLGLHTLQKTIDYGENLGFGIGYMFYDKYSVEMRYQFSRDLFRKDFYWNSNFETLSVILGYSIF